MDRILITGGAGFIGTHLAEKLLKAGHKVVCVDNFELGSQDNVRRLESYDNFLFVRADVSDVESLNKVFRDNSINRVYHLAANSDIQKSAKDPSIDFNNTFCTTYAVLECMRRNGVKNLFFSSTSAVYGNKAGRSVAESEGSLAPISYYGGAKLASEAFISSFAFMNDFDVLVFRFPNVIGPNLTHGVIFDFIRKLKKNPEELEILGDGTQRKPYLYVLDLVDAIVEFSYRERDGVDIYNIGVVDDTSVTEIADMVCARMGLKGVKYKYTGGSVGWKGDVSRFQYDLSRIYAEGWKPAHTSNESVRLTLENVDLDRI